MSVQKVLVEQEFGINQDIHDLVMGRVRFTQLKPTERRVWFTRLSEVSYDYAIETFKKLASRYRDAQGSVRRLKTRLVTETEKVITVEEQRKLESELAELELDFVHWSNLHNPQYPIDGRFTTEREQGQAMLEQLAKRVLKFDMNIPGYGHWRSMEEVEHQLTKLRHQLSGAEAELAIYVKEHDRIDRIVDALRKTGAEGVTSLEGKIRPLQEQRDAALQRMRLKLVLPDPITAKNALETIRESLEATLLTLPANEGNKFSRSRLAELKSGRDLRVAELNEAQSKLNKAIASRDHADAHRSRGSTICPKCQHTWVDGFSETQYAANEKHIEKLTEQLGELKKMIADAEVEIATIVEYSNCYRDFTKLVQTWPVLQPFWDHLLEDHLVFKAPVRAATFIGMLAYDLDQAQQADKLDREIQSLRDMIATALVAGDADLEEALDEQATCEAQVGQVTGRIQALTSEIGACQFFKNRINELLNFAEQIEYLGSQLEMLTLKELESEYHALVRKMLESTLLQLNQKREVVHNAKLQRATVESITHQIEDELLEEEALRGLVKELSPTEGLIAEGLLGFIRNFTGQMNHVVHKIWSYPLQVLPCGGVDSDAAELNYKFPLMVSSRTNVVPDVSGGSSGQKEMVDLAFKVVGMRYAGLSEFPLFLDEFAASFDETHRTAAMLAIKALMDQYPFTQLFMVSHYEGNHGTLTNAEVMVLCGLNITVPSKYNQHVDIL